MTGEAGPDPRAPRLAAKVALVGGRGVGKTALIRRFVAGAFSGAYVPTLGATASRRSVGVELPGTGRCWVDMTLWDATGEEGLRPAMQDVLLPGARGVLAVCDASDPGSVDPMAAWIEAVAGRAGDVPVEIAINKADLEPGGEAVARGLEVCRSHGFSGYLTSAKTGANVADAFYDLAAQIVARSYPPADAPFDPVSLGMVIDASVRPRSLPELARSAGLPVTHALAGAEALVRRGYLRVCGTAVGSDGRPARTFTATGKTFPSLGPARGAGSPRDGGPRTGPGGGGAENAVPSRDATGPLVVKRKICLVGEHEVGKTSLIRRFTKGVFDDAYVATLGAVVSKKTVEFPGPERRPVRVDLVVLDIMGKRTFMQLFRDAYFNGAAGILAVFDRTRRSTLSDLVPWIQNVWDAVGRVPVAVLGNKADLAERVEVRDADVRGILGPLGLEAIETSAKTGENVEEAFLGIARSVSPRPRSPPRPPAPPPRGSGTGLPRQRADTRPPGSEPTGENPDP